MKEHVQKNHWYKIDYDGHCQGRYAKKGECFDQDEKINLRIMKGAYQTKELNFIIKGDVLLKEYSEFTVNGIIDVGNSYVATSVF